MSYSVPRARQPSARRRRQQKAAACGSRIMHWHAPAKPAAASKPQRWPVEAVAGPCWIPAFLDLLHRARACRENWPAGEIELATLLSVRPAAALRNCGWLCRSPASSIRA